MKSSINYKSHRVCVENVFRMIRLNECVAYNYVCNL